MPRARSLWKYYSENGSAKTVLSERMFTWFQRAEMLRFTLTTTKPGKSDESKRDELRRIRSSSPAIITWLHKQRYLLPSRVVLHMPGLRCTWQNSNFSEHNNQSNQKSIIMEKSKQEATQKRHQNIIRLLTHVSDKFTAHKVRTRCNSADDIRL